jgi:hypothetical protein
VRTVLCDFDKSDSFFDFLQVVELKEASKKQRLSEKGCFRTTIGGVSADSMLQLRHRASLYVRDSLEVVKRDW